LSGRLNFDGLFRQCRARRGESRTEPNPHRAVGLKPVDNLQALRAFEEPEPGRLGRGLLRAPESSHGFGAIDALDAMEKDDFRLRESEVEEIGGSIDNRFDVDA